MTDQQVVDALSKALETANRAMEQTCYFVLTMALTLLVFGLTLLLCALVEAWYLRMTERRSRRAESAISFKVEDKSALADLIMRERDDV